MASAMVMTTNGNGRVKQEEQNDVVHPSQESEQHNPTPSKSQDHPTWENHNENDKQQSHSPHNESTNEVKQEVIDTIGTKMQRRVKVYLLKEDSWLDHGTGFCTGEIDRDTQKPYFLVRNELNLEEIILKAFLEGSTQYQRQQDTLIVWTDPSGKDIALSFQETEGCADLCEFIVKVQQDSLSPDISLYYVISSNQADENGNSGDITELITGPMVYPDLPTTSNLEDVLDTLNQSSMSNYSKSCMSKYLIDKSYFIKILEAFKQSEDEHNLINLYSLSEIVKTLILYSESAILQDMLSTEENILGVIGILEYDAEFPNQKSCHRQFLKEKANFKMVINLPVENDELGLNIFKKDFYYTFLKDVILARFIDDQTYNLLNALIHLNQIALLDFLRDSEKNNHFLEKLFDFYKGTGDEVDITLQRNGVKLLHQYVLLTKNFASNQRTMFFSELISHGLIDMIKFSLNDDDSPIKALGTELIVSIIEQDVSLVNSINDGESIDNSEPPMDYASTIEAKQPDQSKDESNQEKDIGLKLSDDMTLMTLLTQLLLNEKNFGLKTQAFEALKVLLDQNIGKIDENGAIPDYGASNSSGSDISTEDYFKAFYSEVAPILYKNLIELGNTKEVTEELKHKIKSDELLYQQLCELFSFCLLTHNKNLHRRFFLDQNILLGISRLFKINCKMSLKISAVGCLSNALAFNDKWYTRYLLKSLVIDEFFAFFKTVSKANNLANSTCLSLLEVFNEIPLGRNRPAIRALVAHIHDNFKDFCLKDLEYVQTGRNLIKLHEQLDSSHISMNSSLASNINANGDLNTDGDLVEEDEEYPVGDEGDYDDFHDYYSKETFSHEESEIEEENEVQNTNDQETDCQAQHKNLFEEIQKEFDTKKEKRQRDNDSNGADPESGTQAKKKNIDTQQPNETNNLFNELNDDVP